MAATASTGSATPDGTNARAIALPMAIVVVSAALVLGAERLVIPGPDPLISGLAAHDRVELYQQISVIAATTMGFVIAAVAILASLDPARPIVADLRRGEAFPLLVANLLAAVLLLLLATIATLVGSIVDDAKAGSLAFENTVEILSLAAMTEFVLGGSLFGYVTYKAARF
jgi:hypothetical protein